MSRPDSAPRPLPMQATNPNRRGGKGGKHGKEQGIERWSHTEDALIRRLCPVRTEGNTRQHNWLLIQLEFNDAKLGPPRTIKALRNRINRLHKGAALVRAGKAGKYYCSKCGKIKLGHVCPGAKLGT